MLIPRSKPFLFAALGLIASVTLLHAEDAAVKQSVAKPKETPVLLTSREKIDDNVGKLVTIKGEVTNTKIPSILGIDVESSEPDLRGKAATATGILKKWTVTEEELKKQIEEKGIFANRGAGTFYRLADPKTGVTVQVQAAQR